MTPQKNQNKEAKKEGSKQVANEENLIPFSERSKNEQRELARKGGIASGKSRRKKRDLRQIAEYLTNIALSRGKAAELEDIKHLKEVQSQNLTVGQAIVLKQIELALKGDSAAFKNIRDILNDQPASRTARKQNAEIKRINAQTKKLNAESEALEKGIETGQFVRIVDDIPNDEDGAEEK